MILTKIVNSYAKVLEKIIMLLMVALLAAVSLQVLGRYVSFIPRYLWTVEITNISLTWVIFIGASIGIKESRHFYVNFLPKNINNTTKLVTRIIYYILMFFITAVFIIFGIKFFKTGIIQESQTTGMNLGVVYSSVPFAGISWLLFITNNLILEIKGDDPK